MKATIIFIVFFILGVLISMLMDKNSKLKQRCEWAIKEIDRLSFEKSQAQFALELLKRENNTEKRRLTMEVMKAKKQNEIHKFLIGQDEHKRTGT